MLTEIPIKAIIPSKNPIRQTRDESKIKELAQSIAEKGVLQPIKVRPIRDDIIPCSKHHFEVLENTYLGELDECLECGDLLSKMIDQDYYDNTNDYEFVPSFEIVFGARRFEASHILELDMIPAIVHEMDDNDALLDGLIENIQREDMSDLDKAYAFQAMIDNGLSQRELSSKLSINLHQIQRHLGLLKHSEVTSAFYEEGDYLSSHPKDAKTKIEYIVSAIPEDIELQKKVARKSVREELGQNKVKKLAESLNAAPTLEAREKLLEWEFNSDLHDPEMIKDRAERLGIHDPLYQDEKPSAQESWDKAPDIKIIVDSVIQAVKAFTQLTNGLKKTAKTEGKFSFEASQFIVTKLEKFRDEINGTIELLKGDK